MGKAGGRAGCAPALVRALAGHRRRRSATTPRRNKSAQHAICWLGVALPRVSFANDRSAGRACPVHHLHLGIGWAARLDTRSFQADDRALALLAPNVASLSMPSIR